MNRVLLDKVDYDNDMDVVLYYLPDNKYTPYVTWMASKKNPEDTYWGHYFENLVDAEEDFNKRAFSYERDNSLAVIVHKLGGSPGEYHELRKEFRGY